MSQQVTYTCDECGAVKAAVNHWYICEVIKALHRDKLVNVVVRPFEPVLGVEVKIVATDCVLKTLHLCGRECVVKCVSKTIGGAS